MTCSDNTESVSSSGLSNKMNTCDRKHVTSCNTWFFKSVIDYTDINLVIIHTKSNLESSAEFILKEKR